MGVPKTISTGLGAGHRTASMLTRSLLDDHCMTAGDRQTLLGADRRGLPYLVYRDGENVQRLLTLDSHQCAITIGRGETADVSVDWDRGVSREHATLVLCDGGWTIVDDETSLNGTFVNRERVRRRRPLRDRDLIQIGEVGIAFRDPSALA
jgi:hypothetical protein